MSGLETLQLIPNAAYKQIGRLLLAARDPRLIVYSAILHALPVPFPRSELQKKTKLSASVLAEALRYLYQEGFLEKMHSGREVYYYAKF